MKTAYLHIISCWKISIVCLLFTFFNTGYFAVAQQSDTSYLKIVFAGDIMGHDGQIAGAYIDSTGGYDYEPTFRYVKPYLQKADIALGNLEVTLAGPPFKGYPQFSSPDNFAFEAAKAGFNIMVTANNHSLDRGTKGFNRTLSVLDSMKIIQTGTFFDAASRNKFYPLIIEKNNIRLAILNYTYGTNGLTIKPPSIVNMIDTAQIRLDLQKARLAVPDFIFVTIHWGNEYERDENKVQQRLAEFMIKNGADAIIGSHPHVVQPVKLFYADKSDSSRFNIIVYSLGNFISNQRTRYRDGGIIFETTLMKSGNKTAVSDYNYLPVWVYRKDLNQKSTFMILPVGLYNNNEEYFNLPDHDKYKITQFYQDTKEHLKSIPENRFYSDFIISVD